MKTQEQIEIENGYYQQAVEMRNKIYNAFNVLFEDNNLVAYVVELSQWDDHSTVRAFAMIGYGNSVSNSLRDLAGTFSEEISFAKFTKEETISGFFDKVMTNVQTFVRRAKNVKDIVEQQTNN